MKSAFLLLLTMFLAVVVVQAFYWNLIRPLVLTKLRYRIFAARDRLRFLLINHGIGPKEPAFGLLERMCNDRIRCLPQLSFSMVLFSKIPVEIELAVENEMAIIQTADPQLRDIYEEITHLIFGATLVNSPAWVPLISGLMILRYWSNGAAARLRGWQTKSMAEAADLAEHCPA